MSIVHQDSVSEALSETDGHRRVDEKSQHEEAQAVTKVNSVNQNGQNKSYLAEYYRAVEDTYRHHWWQIWKPSSPPPPPLANMDDAPDIPLANASFLSVLFFTWITPVMVIGWQRALQVSEWCIL